MLLNFQYIKGTLKLVPPYLGKVEHTLDINYMWSYWIVCHLLLFYYRWYTILAMICISF